MALEEVIGSIPYRMALAGGWIDQPFVSKMNPEPPGSMVVVSLEPDFMWMDRCGMATSTRQVAARLWGGALPPADPQLLVRQLYEEENRGRFEPSGSQDMVGLLHPGISRLDYDYSCHEGIFPSCVESMTDPLIAQWLERVIHVLPVAQRPEGYSPFGHENLDPSWVTRLGLTGRACWEAILHRDLAALGASMNDCMACWETILPHTVRHPTITIDLLGLLHCYQDRFSGAMYSGCGGGYLYVVSEEPVPGSFGVKVRLKGG